jgi:tetratricopeptide (TPR) repeat protein
MKYAYKIFPFLLCSIFFIFRADAQSEIWTTYMKQGSVAKQRKQYSEAEGLFKAALSEAQSRDDLESKKHQLYSLWELAEVAKAKETIPVGLDYVKQATEIKQKIPDLDWTLDARIDETFGDLALSGQDYSTAEAKYREVINLYDSKGNKSVHNRLMSKLASNYAAQGKNVQAQALFKEALYPLPKEGTPVVRQAHDAAEKYATVLDTMSLPGEAKAVRLAYANVAKELSFDEAQKASEKYQEAVEALKKDDYETAIADLEPIVKESPTSRLPAQNLAIAYQHKGIALQIENNLSGAASAFQKSLELMPNAFGNYHPNVVNVLMALAEVKLKLGDKKAAEELSNKAFSISQGERPELRQNYAHLLEFRSKLFRQEKNEAAAQEVDKQITDVHKAAEAKAIGRWTMVLQNLICTKLGCDTVSSFTEKYKTSTIVFLAHAKQKGASTTLEIYKGTGDPALDQQIQQCIYDSMPLNGARLIVGLPESFETYCRIVYTKRIPPTPK